jgi:hypothetical protein
MNRQRGLLTAGLVLLCTLASGVGPGTGPSLAGRRVAAAEPTVVLQPECSGTAVNPVIRGLTREVSQVAVTGVISDLQRFGTRYAFAPEDKLDQVRAYVRQGLAASGLSVDLQPFIIDSTTQDNIEGTLPGWGPGEEVVYLITAHYDSTAHGNPQLAAPGADDNGSGTAAVLEAARLLSRYRFHHTLRFVAFAAEEQGLLGSAHYASAARQAQAQIAGVLNVDMVAWDGNHDAALDVHAGDRSPAGSQALAAAFVQAVAAYGIPLVPQTITVGAEEGSDHASFWARGYPAVLLIEDEDDFNPYYHSTGDTLDKLDLPYATHVVQASVATLAELAEIIPPGINVQQRGPASVTAGEMVTLGIGYTVPGPDAAAGVVLTATLGSGLQYVADNSDLPLTRPGDGVLVWSVGNLPAYSRQAFVYTTTVAATALPSTQLSSTVEIGGVTPWDDPSDDLSTWLGTVAGQGTDRSHYLPLLWR